MKAQKVLYWIILLVVAANLAIIAVVVLGSHSTPPTPLPSPNGYDDFMKGASLLTGDIWNYDSLTESGLRNFVHTNSAALNQLRTGLGRECRVPTYSPTNGQAISDLISLKHLAGTLMAEGRLAELEHRTNDALKSYVDVVRLADKGGRGGPMIYALVRFDVEAVGLPAASNLTSCLSADKCREAVSALQAIDDRGETMDQISEASNAFLKRAGLRAQLMADVLNFRQRRRTEASVARRFQRNQRWRRQTLLAFAARAYTLDKGDPPKAAADLVPAYLKAVPQDPVTGADMTLGHSPR